MERWWAWSRERTPGAGLLLVIGSALSSPAGWSLIFALQVAPLPPFFHLFASVLRALTFFFLPLTWLLLLVSLPVHFGLSFTARFSQPYRKYRVFYVAALVILIGSWPSRNAFEPLRRRGLIGMTHRAKPLIASIEAFRKQTGEYPASLDDLVPDFIDEIPFTGAVGYPEFRYGPTTEGSPYRKYQLQVRTPSAGINFDSFVYWPEGNYPARLYGEPMERIEDWAYIHE